MQKTQLKQNKTKQNKTKPVIIIAGAIIKDVTMTVTMSTLIDSSLMTPVSSLYVYCNEFLSK